MILCLAFLLIGSVGTYFLMRGEVMRLRQENSELLGSLFARIGYKPESLIKKEGAVSGDEQTMLKHAYSNNEGIPDVLQRQNVARDE